MNIQVQLIRTIDNGVETTGKLYVTGDQHLAVDTLERPFLDNKNKVSSIPAGRYHCMKVVPSEAIPYYHISITNVPNRSGVCIHAGNFYSDSKGCILVGNGYSDINKDGQVDILHSKDTLTKLMNVLPDEFSLEITEAQIKPNIS